MTLARKIWTFIRQLLLLIVFQLLINIVLKLGIFFIYKSFITPKQLEITFAFISLGGGSWLYGLWEEIRHPQLLAPNAKKLAISVSLIYVLPIFAVLIINEGISQLKIIELLMFVFFIATSFGTIIYFLEKGIKHGKNFPSWKKRMKKKL